MNMDEITQKCIKVITNCKNQKQLDGAIIYANLAWKLLPGDTSWKKRVEYLNALERLIGFTQRNVQVSENIEIAEQVVDVVDHIRVLRNRMRGAANAIKDLAFEMAPPNEYTPRFIEIALLLEKR